MSYILDALRKADAQRSRDPMRGIGAQPVRGLGTSGPPSRVKPWAIGAALAGVAALGYAGWYLAQERESKFVPASALGPAPSEQPAPVVGRAVMPPPVVIAPAPVVQAPAAVVPMQAPIAQAQAGLQTGIAPLGGDPRNTSRPTMRGRQLPAAALQNSGPQPMQAPQPQFQPQQPPGMAPLPTTPAIPVQPQGAPLAPHVAAQAPPPAPAAGLPPDAPKLSISGGVYSANRAQRMLIVNGQVFNEGSEITGGVVLEEVQAKTAVLRFRGNRYTVTY